MALAGLRVGTIAGRRGAQLADAMRRRGATVLWGPTLRADVAERVDVLLSATDLILAAAPRFVAVSTAVGIRRWIAVADEFGRGPALHALFTAAHLAARGPKAVSGLLAVGHRPAFVSPARIDADVARWLAGRVTGADAVAVQLHGSGTLATFGRVEHAGARLHPIAPYRCELPDDPGPAQRLIAAAVAGDLDVIVATNAATVDNLFVLAADRGLRDTLVRALNDRVAVVAIGPVTAAAFERAGAPIATMPREPHTGELLRTLAGWVQRRRDGHMRDLAVPRFRLEPDVGVVRVGDRDVVLSTLEFAVLAALVRRPGVVCPTTSLTREVWGHVQPRSARQVKHHIARIRRKLGAHGAAIESVRAVGYRYNPTIVVADVH